ncbi:MAG: hypothetical protein WA162_01595 [Thermodesulfobacteriota bacterium]
MKKISIVVIALFFATIFLFSPALVDAGWVNGYYKSNGTYVEGYYRSSPNNSVLDNYSTKGNSNPYTLEKGYVDPYKDIYKPTRIQPYSPYNSNRSLYR